MVRSKCDRGAVIAVEADLNDQVRSGSLEAGRVVGVGDVEITTVIATTSRADHPPPDHDSRSAT